MYDVACTQFNSKKQINAIENFFVLKYVEGNGYFILIANLTEKRSEAPVDGSCLSDGELGGQE